MASWEHTALKVWALLKPFFATKHCQKPCPQRSLPCGHTRRSRNEALSFFCGLFVVSFYEFPLQS